MNYILPIVLFIVATIIHYHYYKWRIFNTNYNLPQIYRSDASILIVFLSKILLFSVVAVFINWYFVLIIFLFLQLLKFVAFKDALRWHAAYSYVLQGRKLLGDNNASKKVVDSKLSREKSKEIWNQEKKIYRMMLFKYKNQQLSRSFFSKILYLIT